MTVESLRLSSQLAPEPSRLSERATQVARAFGIDTAESVPALFTDVQVPRSGLVLITGYSGAGKTTLLDNLIRRTPGIVTPKELELAQGAVIDLFGGAVDEVVSWLGLFGLSEARVMISSAEVLSVGQQHRLELARLLWGRPPAVAIDEFLATLDRTTARVVAHGFQKACRRAGTTAYLCTAHEDLVDALDPDQLIRLDLTGRHGSSYDGGAPGRCGWRRRSASAAGTWANTGYSPRCTTGSAANPTSTGRTSCTRCGWPGTDRTRSRFGCSPGHSPGTGKPSRSVAI